MEKLENVKQVQCQEVREAAGIICDILIHIMIMRLLIESYWITGYQLICMLVDQNMLLDTYYILVCGIVIYMIKDICHILSHSRNYIIKV